eukprot:COSAG01_NODE_51337_length_355_cov_1.414062_1_plen_31_part_01
MVAAFTGGCFCIVPQCFSAAAWAELRGPVL